MENFNAVLFDMDGTLSDTGEGVMNGVRIALQKMGRPVPEQEILRRFIGPPAHSAYMEFCGMSDTDAAEAVRYFREFYNETGWLQSFMYPGMTELLRDLRTAGKKVGIASSKPQPSVEQILAHYGALDLFNGIAGSAPNGGEAAKPELIKKAAALCGVPLEELIMVGDTHFDADGAAEIGVRFIGVTYGYGTRAELQAAGTKILAASAEELREILLPGNKHL